MHGAPRPIVSHGDLEVTATFGALFQGDHIGVEVATDAHARLLQGKGLLRAGTRLSSSSFVFDDECVDGLIIDDYCVVSKEDVGTKKEVSRSVRSLEVAQRCYDEEGLMGSRHKDVVGENLFKFAGAEVVSTQQSVARGVVALGAPFSKRLGLGLLSAKAAELRSTSDALWSSVIGSWISVLMYRRPCMAVLDEVFKVIPAEELDTLNPRLRHLPRRAAEELLVLAALSPVVSSNLATEFAEEIFAADASNLMGGATVASVSEEIAKLVWRSSEQKADNVPMLRKGEAVLAAHDSLFEEKPFERTEEVDGQVQHPARPVALSFQFVEICGGAGVVTKALSKQGIVVGPVLDISFSKQYDLKQARVIQWVIYLVEEDRLDSFLMAPPCTTFSAAAYPCLRSYVIPRGFDPKNERVIEGNQLAFAMLCLLYVALRMQKLGMGEQPRRSKMRRLEEWQRLIAMGASEVTTASCAFGSKHMKEFVFLSVNMRCEALHRKCSRDHAHVRIEGKFTKPSATYVEGLAEEIARVFVLHLQRLDVLRQEKGLDVRGLEDPLSDDLCLGLDWKVLGSWRWKKPSHINVLETAADLKVWAHVAREGGDKRFTFLSDSHVSRSVLVRGRSSSDSLRPLLRRAAALCVAYGLYPAGRFVPTRWNPADAPSRGGDLSEKAVCSIMDGLSVQEIAAVASIRGLRRWAANWARLVLLTCPGLVDFLLRPGRRHPNLPISPREWFMDFDATLGYPGEGPLRLPFALFLLLLICQASLWIVLAAPRGSFRHGDDDRKARRTGLQLGDGRRVTELTSFTRANLYAAFLRWLEEKQFPWDETLFCSPPDIDGVNKILVDYGRWLFSEGKPYYHFSETVNAVTCKRPLIRRSLQQVWDLAFIWGSYEPTVHHLAMPPQILTAVLAVCLVWGWVREAAIFALAWGARCCGLVRFFKRDDVT